jgi:hypothetical protein|tara:strand:- start:346 stop:930 length:585 start_codon:yes stop_codon:yes gene_type:complete
VKFLKPINDGESINDKRVFILETEETIFDVSVKHYLINEGDCLRLHYQVDDSNKLEKTRYSVKSGDYLNEKEVIDIITMQFESTRLYNGLPRFGSSGFLTEEGFNKIISGIKSELDKNNDLANAFATPFINYLESQSLRPNPSGNNKYSWLSDCPFSFHGHYMMVSTKENTFGCGWCKKKGSQKDLENYFKNKI